MSFSTEIKNELIKLKMWDANSNLKQEEQIAKICIREAFIKSGFINDPKKDYHLEISFKTIEEAEKMKNMLENFNIYAKTVKKGNGTIIYIKDGEEISNFLALIGSNNGVLRFEETRVVKDTRNNINRIVNCETANLSKIIDASVIQIRNIQYLKDTNQFNNLSKQLKEIANARLKSPEASYEELGKMLKEPIGKSGASHRLNKINEIVKELKK